MNAAFKLQAAVCAYTVYPEDYFFVSADTGLASRYYFSFPSFTFSKPGVHTEEVGGEQSCLISSCSASDLDNNASVVIEVLWKKKYLYLLFQIVHL
ncbi:hypothetical protein SDC9_117136 [bioreactor metagenome]|uniref:Uncharacterized protein n=1 Tax=bioreactor metagenome TaxID=1076179 RepID=A0A645C4A8_9ZZZZ